MALCCYQVNNVPDIIVGIRALAQKIFSVLRVRQIIVNSALKLWIYES